MAGNASQGGAAFRGRPDLWYWERLPPAARAALADAAFDWSAGCVYGLWRRGELKTGTKSPRSPSSPRLTPFPGTLIAFAGRRYGRGVFNAWRPIASRSNVVTATGCTRDCN